MKPPMFVSRLCAVMRFQGKVAAVLCTAAMLLMTSSVAGASQGDQKITPRIIGGSDAPVGRYPFMASMFVRTADGDFHWCGGTLIAPRLVLVAAHCSSPEMIATVKVNIGKTTLSDGNQGYVRGIRAVHYHPEWPQQNPTDDLYDIAVLELDAPVTEVAPISLAAAGDRKYEQPGYWVRAIGWGLKQQDPVIEADHLQQVEVPIVSTEVCRMTDPSVKEGPDLCAGTSGLGTCSGDSGGPLFIQEPATQRFVQIGTTSRLASTGSPDCKSYPVIFTRLSHPAVASFIASIPR